MLKELTNASSFDELNKRADIDSKSKNLLRRKTLKSLAQNLKRVCDEGRLKEKSGDEETAYIFFFRACEIGAIIKDNPAFPQFRKQFPGSVTDIFNNYKEALTKCELVSKSLIRRYDLIEEARKIREQTPETLCKKTDVSLFVNETELNPIQLKRIIDDRKRVMILDFRDETGLTEILKWPFSCIHISPSLLVPGCIASHLQRAIPIEQRSAFKSGQSADYIVLMDENCRHKDMQKNGTLNYLYQALYTYNNDSGLLKRRPLVLDGGFENFKLHFPMFVERIIHQQNNEDVSEELAMDEQLENSDPVVAPYIEPAKLSVFYPSIDELERDRKRKWAVTKEEKSVVDTKREFNENEVSIIDEPKPVLPVIPSIPSIPDRNSKPTFAPVSIINEAPQPIKVQPHPRLPKDPETIRKPEIRRPDFPKPEFRRPEFPKPEIRRPEFPKPEFPKSEAPADPQHRKIMPAFDRSLKPSKQQNNDSIVFGAAPGSAESVVTPLVNGESENQRPPSEIQSHGPNRLGNLWNEIRTSFDALQRDCEGKNSKSIPMGLDNMGNTCFMNSVIQALMHTQPLVSLFSQSQDSKPLFFDSVNVENRMGSGGRMAGNFYCLVKIMQARQHKVLTPKRFKQAVVAATNNFDDRRQHDAQEFLALLIDAMHEDLNQGIKGFVIPEQNNFNLTPEQFPQSSMNAWRDYQKKTWSPIYDVFAGQLVSTMECSVCHMQSSTYDIFTQITCELPQSPETTLADCLKSHFTREIMTDAEWSCVQCKVKRAATKEIKLCRLPGTLIVHLKRFKPVEDRIVKNDSAVSFPLHLEAADLIAHFHPHADKHLGLFRLYAIVHHSGGLGQGHYTATCKYKERWIHFDDESLSDGSPYLNASPYAYMLFYERVRT